MILMVLARFQVKWTMGTILRTPEVSSRREPTIILMASIILYNTPSWKANILRY
jgi:hypothetical protein